MRSNARKALLAGAVLGFFGVALGAFGAHALKETLILTGRLETWKTAVLYQLVHALALVALAGLPDMPKTWITRCWLVGVVLFSGSLFVLCLSGVTAFGAITPVGGIAFLAGWGLLAFEAFRK